MSPFDTAAHLALKYDASRIRWIAVVPMESPNADSRWIELPGYGVQTSEEVAAHVPEGHFVVMESAFRPDDIS